MPIESESFEVGDRVRPFVQYVKSLDEEHRIPYGRYTIAAIGGQEDGERLFLRFRDTEGEYPAYRFTKEPSRPTTRN